MAAGTPKMFRNALAKMADGTIDWDTDSFRALLIGSGYTEDLTDTAFSDMSAQEVSGTGYTATQGVACSAEALSQPSAQVVRFDLADITFSAVTLTAKWLIIFHDADGNGTIASTDVPIFIVELESGGTVSPSAGDLVATINASGIYNITLGS